ncbi:MAG: SMC-Scp complex subunit ScpB [Alphaproteobacteria bacterium]|nr:MAG: SMC-Scp complex subunit ScpB [Alphaproteobacteria bacterium]
MDADKLLAERRMVEAVLFAATKPLALGEIAARLPAGVDVGAHVAALVAHYGERGVNLVKVADKWQFRTPPDLAFLLREEVEESRKLSRAAVETLAIIAYHQPVTRAEIEELRGVGLSKGTLDVLMEAGWVRPRGRKQVPGRPVLYATSEEFLVHFGLETINDLPGLEELKAAGMLEPMDQALEGLLGKMVRVADGGDDTASSDADEQEDAPPLL